MSPKMSPKMSPLAQISSLSTANNQLITSIINAASDRSQLQRFDIHCKRGEDTTHTNINSHCLPSLLSTSRCNIDYLH